MGIWVLTTLGEPLSSENALAAESVTNAPFLSQPGVGGVCRGFLRLITAPFVVPLSCVYGFTVPFTCDPELGGTTNYVVYSAVQTAATPLYVGANTLVGSCACGIEAARGLADIVFLGYYDLPDAKQPEAYDSRPYFIQIAENMSHSRGELLLASVSSAP